MVANDDAIGTGIDSIHGIFRAQNALKGYGVEAGVSRGRGREGKEGWLLGDRFAAASGTQDTYIPLCSTNMFALKVPSYIQTLQQRCNGARE